MVWGEGLVEWQCPRCMHINKVRVSHRLLTDWGPDSPDET